MWKNKVVKKRARQALKANYWTLVALCFVLVFIGVAQGLGSGLLTNTSTDSSTSTVTSEDGTAVTESTKTEEESSITTYLIAFLQGSDKTRDIAFNVLDSFKGTGGIAYRVFYSLERLVIMNDWVARIVIIAAFILYLVYEFLFKNIMMVGYMRTLEESRTYSKTGFMRVFCIFKSDSIWNVVAVMILKDLWLSLLIVIALLPFILTLMMVTAGMSALWLLAGFLVSCGLSGIAIWQTYQITLVPYILAVNPALKRREAFALSKEMMQGNKLHAFGLDCSFIGWTILSVLTLGLLDIFFLRPYVYQTKCELFMVLREGALSSGSEKAAVLADPYLTCPEPSLAEGDVNADHGIFAQPYPMIEPEKLNKLEQYIVDLNPKRKYAFANLVLLFFSFAMIGWLWEVFLYLVNHGEFVNRGMLHGPWLPIYGFGGILAIILLRRFADKPLLAGLMALLTFGLLEYFTSFFFELIKGQRWWDYSDHFLNINGRVCFEGLLVFVLAGLAVIYLVGPLLDNIYQKLDAKKKMIVGVILMAVFAGDVVYSQFHPNKGRGITDQIKSQTEVQCLISDADNVVMKDPVMHHAL